MNTRADGMPTNRHERQLRRMLAAAYHFPNTYFDDGEAQAQVGPTSIDFMRDTPDEIQAKLLEINLRKYRLDPRV